MMWLAADQDKTNFTKRTGILLLFGLLKVIGSMLNAGRRVMTSSTCTHAQQPQLLLL